MAADHTMRNALPGSLPSDVRLMNLSAGLLTVLGALLLAGMATLWLARHPAFAVRVIRIEGDVTRNSVATIRANAAPRLAGNFFTADLAQTRNAFESVPWVRQAVVNRVWPSRLVVRLEEHRALALWGNDSAGDKLVNSHGEVFEANVGDVEDDALPTLSGPEGSSVQMLGLLQRLVPVMAPLQVQIETLSLSGRGSWRVDLDSGATVELGRGSDDEVVARTERFIATVGQLITHHQRPLESADLRHKDGYAVRLRGVSTTLTSAETAAAKAADKAALKAADKAAPKAADKTAPKAALKTAKP